MLHWPFPRHEKPLVRVRAAVTNGSAAATPICNFVRNTAHSCCRFSAARSYTCGTLGLGDTLGWLHAHDGGTAVFCLQVVRTPANACISIMLGRERQGRTR